jgi:hypothetical protein
MESLKDRRPYEAPIVREMSEDEVLAAFQMSAAEISAGTCWWGTAMSGCT